MKVSNTEDRKNINGIQLDDNISVVSRFDSVESEVGCAPVKINTGVSESRVREIVSSMVGQQIAQNARLIQGLQSAIGNLLNLETANRLNLVAAINELQSDIGGDSVSFFNKVSLGNIAAVTGDGIRAKNISTVFLPVGAPDSDEVLVTNESSGDIQITSIGSTVGGVSSYAMDSGSTLLFVKDADTNNWIPKYWSESSTKDFMKFSQI